MSKRKDPMAERDELRRTTERLVFEALYHAGDLVPTTPEDVARVEEQLKGSPDPVPASLLSPPDLNRPFARRQRPCAPALDASTQQNLARAARDGKTIPQNIEELMQKDREAAERNGSGK